MASSASTASVNMLGGPLGPSRAIVASSAAIRAISWTRSSLAWRPAMSILSIERRMRSPSRLEAVASACARISARRPSSSFSAASCAAIVSASAPSGSASMTWTAVTRSRIAAAQSASSRARTVSADLNACWASSRIADATSSRSRADANTVSNSARSSAAPGATSSPESLSRRALSASAPGFKSSVGSARQMASIWRRRASTSWRAARAFSFRGIAAPAA